MDARISMSGGDCPPSAANTRSRAAAFLLFVDRWPLQMELSSHMTGKRLVTVTLPERADKVNVAGQPTTCATRMLAR